LKRDLVNRLKQVGAYDVGVADPAAGWEHALKGRRPLDLWEHTRSVVVFIVAASPASNNTYVGPYAPWRGDRRVGPVPQNIQSDEFAMDRFFRLFIASITLKGMTLLSSQGHRVGFSPPQMKLAAYEAGIGVYGRSGLILHPVLGNRIRIGAILTDAVLEPDGRLENFDPCEDCSRCIDMCPAKAYDPSKSYPHSWSREKCMAKRQQIADRGLYCHNCFAVCPAGEIADEGLLCERKAKSFLKRDRVE
jgi:epoxyqueuosine reductase QueG